MANRPAPVRRPWRWLSLGWCLWLVLGAARAQQLPPAPRTDSARVAAPDTTRRLLAAPPAAAPADTARRAPTPVAVVPPIPFPDSVRGQLTARHRRVPGSTFYVQASADFAAEESLNGLVRPDGTLLEVVRVPHTDFGKIRRYVLAQYLGQGERVLEQHELTFGGYPAVYGRGHGLEPGKDLQVLAFGDSAATGLVFGLYATADTAVARTVRRLLLTGYYDAQGTVPPLELAPFVVTLTGTPYRLLTVDTGQRLYTFGRTPAAVADTFATRFTVQVLRPQSVEQLRPHLYQLGQALTTPGATLKSEEHQLLVAPFGYEISGQSRLRGRRNTFYQLVRTDEDASLLLQAVAFEPKTKPPTTRKKGPTPPPAPEPLADIRKLAATLRMKR